MQFRIWVEQSEKQESQPLIALDNTSVPWETWKDWTDPIEFFAYGDMIASEKRPTADFHTARARGMIRVFDVPAANGREGLLSIRKTGRLEDVVNGLIFTVPGEDVQEMGSKYPGYHLGTVTVILTDAENGLPMRKKKTVFYLFNPKRLQRKLQPNAQHLRQLLQNAYQISPQFGDEFVRTTFRLPKRGSRLVRITR